MLDYNIFFHRFASTASYSQTPFSVLADADRTLEYINENKDAAIFTEIEKALFDWQKPEKSELFAISLMFLDMYSNSSGLRNNNLFIINAAALIANRIKKLFASPVVIGSEELPKPACHQILSRYSCFDFAIYAGGETAILRLTDRLAGKKVQLLNALEKKNKKILFHSENLSPESKGSADYKGYPLKMYENPIGALFERYDPKLSLIKKNIARANAETQLIVPYQFDNSCSAKCAFCPSGDLSFKSSNTVDQTFEDLCRLKELGATGIYFINTNFNNTYKFADELCDKMIKARLNLLWCDCANFRELDEQLLLKMKKSGAVKLTFGFETGSRRLLRLIRKGISTVMIEKHLRSSNAAGIWNAIELIAGLPSEVSSDVRETAVFLGKIASLVDSFALSPFHLFKQSPFGRKPSAFGIRLLGDDLRNVNYLTAGAMRYRTRKFNEANGLAWPEKKKQTCDSERYIRAALSRLGCLYDTPQHMHLLMSLYRAFGYSNKQLIRTLFNSATTQYKPYFSGTFMVRQYVDVTGVKS